MRTWRKKRMPVAKWAELQDRFAALFMASGGNREMAMFVNSEPGASEQDIYITARDVGMVESLSPGGWEDSALPAGSNISLLVGNADAREHFGIHRPEKP